MDLELTETQTLLRAGISDLLGPLDHGRVSELARSGSMDVELWARLADAGWLSLALVDDADTASVIVDMAVVIEQVARSVAVVPLAETVSCARAIVDRGSPPAREFVRAELPTGSLSIAAAIQSNTGAARIRAGRLSGTARFVDFGSVCSYHAIGANDETGQPGLYLVAADQPGVAFTPLSHIGQTPQANVTYRDVVALHAGAADALVLAVHLNTIAAAVQLVAFGDVALDLTLEHVRRREQFGQPLGAFQAVQHQCADMATLLVAARFLVFETAWRIGGGMADATDLALAKAAASRAAMYSTLQAHQLHGGMGVSEEYPLHLFTRRAKARAVSWGSEFESLQVLAASVDRSERWI